MAVERHTDRRLGGLGQFDRNQRFVAERGFRPKSATHVIGDDMNLCVIQLEVLGNLGSQLRHNLR